MGEEAKKKATPKKKSSRVAGRTQPDQKLKNQLWGVVNVGVFPTPGMEAVPSAHAHRDVCALFLRVCGRLGYNRATVLAHLEFE